MANSAGGARALERSLGRAGGVRAQPSPLVSPEISVVTNMGVCQRPSEYPGIASPREKIDRSICQNISRSTNDVTWKRFNQVRF